MVVSIFTNENNLARIVAKHGAISGEVICRNSSIIANLLKLRLKFWVKSIFS
jgi:hypothetical protein